MTERSGFSFDLRLSVGGAQAEFTERDRPVADFDAVAIGGAARFGWFLSPHILLGAELAGAWHGGVGTLRIRDPGFFYNGIPDEASYGLFSPLGVFVELYPLIDEGWFISAAAGIGGMSLPRFGEAQNSGLMSGYSLELGYELSGAAKVGPAPFIRFSTWAAEESPFSSEHPDGLLSRELLVGLRWSFWTPEWR